MMIRNEELARRAAAFRQTGSAAATAALERGAQRLGINSTLQNCFIMVFFFLIIIPAMVGIVAMGILYSTQGSTISSQMVVLTSVRSRDWSVPNAYSMHYQDTDEHSRLYNCMRQAGVSTPSATLELNFNTYRKNIMTTFKRGRNCDRECDNSWPRDYGFLNCIVPVFNMSMHQTNKFINCMDISEGVMVASIQPPASMRFMGSYNFVAFLLTGAAILTTFMMLMLGGFYTGDKITLTSMGNIGNAFFPLGLLPTQVAFLLSFIWLVFGILYAFTGNFWSDIPAQPGRLSFPNTPWTGLTCFTGLLLNFLCVGGYWLETYFGEERGAVVVGQGGLEIVPAVEGPLSRASSSALIAPIYASGSAVEGGGVIPRAPSSGVGDVSFSSFPVPIPGTLDPVSGSVSRDLFVNPAGFIPTYSSLPTSSGPNVAPFTRAASVRSLFTATAYRPSRRHYHRLGTKFPYPDDGEHAASELDGTIFQMISLSLLLSDVYIFVGMITPQNSPLHESVIAVMRCIFFCRFAQFASSFFLHDVLSGKNAQGHTHSSIAFFAGQLTSLCFAIAAYYNVFATGMFVESIHGQGIYTNSHFLQLSFFIALILIEAGKHIISFYHLVFKLPHFMLYWKLVYNFECILRVLVSLLTIKLVLDYLPGENQTLKGFLMP